MAVVLSVRIHRFHQVSQTLHSVDHLDSVGGGVIRLHGCRRPWGPASRPLAQWRWHRRDHGWNGRAARRGEVITIEASAQVAPFAGPTARPIRPGTRRLAVRRASMLEASAGLAADFIDCVKIVRRRQGAAGAAVSHRLCSGDQHATRPRRRISATQRRADRWKDRSRASAGAAMKMPVAVGTPMVTHCPTTTTPRSAVTAVRIDNPDKPTHVLEVGDGIATTAETVAPAS